MKPSIQMLSPFFCGTFQPEDDDYNDAPIKTSPSSTPRRSFIKRQSFCTRTTTANKNPYSSRGLEKFEALLADLEEKKKKIYTQVGPGDISLVRFAYTSSNNCVPIVVKSKDNKNKDYYSKSPPKEKQQQDEEDRINKTEPVSQRPDPVGYSEAKTTALTCFVDQWRKPSYYMPAAVMLIMVLLVFFGRSVAILCVSIGWYMIPAIGSSSKAVSGEKRRSNRNKGRDLQRDGLDSLEKVKSPVTSPVAQKHGHRRSW